MKLKTTLTTIMVVNGAKSLKPSLTITKSPGRRRRHAAESAGIALFADELGGRQAVGAERAAELL